MDFYLRMKYLKVKLQIIIRRFRWKKQFWSFLITHMLLRKNTEYSNKTFDTVLSMASYPKRIKYVQYTLFSLFFQTVRFEKMYICLYIQDFPSKKIPIQLNLVISAINNFHKKKLIEIIWCEDLKSYKKLLPLLQQGIQKTIITVDDDVYYSNDWLLKMQETHLRFPNCICSHYARKVSLNKPYSNWDILQDEEKPDYFNYSVGVGGTLYPRHCFYKDVIIYPNGVINDDLYFWFMSVLNQTKTVVVKDHCGHPTPTILEDETPCMWKQHAITGENDRCLSALRKKYPQFDDIVGVVKK